MTQYREIKRKANVGERIKWTNDAGTESEIYVVTGVRENGDVGVNDDHDDGTCGISYSHYVVLEPVNDDIRRIIDGLTSTVASLSVRLAAAERTIAEMTCPTKHPLTQAFEALRKPFLTRTRDAIIERAKRDVAELERIGGDRESVLNGSSMFYGQFYRVKFVINRDKRTVVALLFDRFGEIVIGRGIAKCAPDDVFSGEIGKAIAIRRALGLTVPTEYTGGGAN